MEKPLTTTHNLDFLQSERGEKDDDIVGFKVGTCHGLFYQTKEALCLLVVVNEEIGNGHFTDVLEWFEFSARIQGLYFDVIHVWNQRLRKHLIEKKGFVAIEADHLRKEVVDK